MLADNNNSGNGGTSNNNSKSSLHTSANQMSTNCMLVFRVYLPANGGHINNVIMLASHSPCLYAVSPFINSFKS
jgi:hypothetical protein